MAVYKKEFTDRMAANGGITKKAARLGFDLFVETLMDYMSEDEKVVFTGFGRFEMKTLKERKARLPLGGKECVIPKHKKMRFYSSDLLTDRMKEIKKGD